MSFLKNLFFRFVVFFRRFQKTNPIDPDYPKILIISTTALGDTLWATPSIEMIKKAYPNAHLSILTSSIGSEILKNNPYLDEIIPLPNLFSKKMLSFLPFLKKKKFQIAFLFHASQRYTLPLCSLIGLSKIIGTEHLNKGLDFLLTKKLEKKKQHEIERRLDMLTFSGLKSLTSKLQNTQTRFYITSKERKWAEDILPKNECVIGIHPGAKDHFKCWPTYHFAKLINLLKENLNCEIIVTGTLAEAEILDEIESQTTHKILRFDHLPFRKFASLVAKLDLLITNDTGPMHLASALSRPLISIFSPTDPFVCGPEQNEKTTVFYKEKTCTPCLKRKCNQPFCLMQTGPKQVLQAALKHLT